MTYEEETTPGMYDEDHGENAGERILKNFGITQEVDKLKRLIDYHD